MRHQGQSNQHRAREVATGHAVEGAVLDLLGAPVTQYNLLLRWFIGLSTDDSVWVPTVFTRDRERLIEHDAVVAFFNAVLKQADKKRWLSKEHFSVNGTLIQAWAGHKSFVRKDGKDEDDSGDFRPSHADG